FSAIIHRSEGIPRYHAVAFIPGRAISPAALLWHPRFRSAMPPRIPHGGFVMRSLSLLALVCLTGCASLEQSLVYHPRPYDAGNEQPGDGGTNVELTTASQAKVNARWYPQPNCRTTILYCPGNAGNLHGRAASVKDLGVNLGASILIFDYPGYG